MTHTTTIDAASDRAELESPIILSLSKEAQVPLIHHTIKRSALTATEQSLLHWLATGRTNAQIADRLKRSEKTVRNQLTSVYAKLGVVNRAQAVAVHMRMQFGPRERR